MDKIRIVVADDHPTFREGLSRFLEDESDFQVVGKAVDGVEAVKLVEELHPDVVVIDVAMPAMNGVEAAKLIKAGHPATAILMVSAYGYESYILAAIRAGAEGFLLKNAPLTDLIGAIRSVHAGRGVFDLKAASKVLRRIAGDRGAGERDTELRRRELAVLKLTAKGMSNKEIAVDLGISERTVQTHLVNIFRKMRVDSRTEAVLHALKQGLLTLDDLPDRQDKAKPGVA